MISTIQEAKDAGLFHPNCVHAIEPLDVPATSFLPESPLQVKNTGFTERVVKAVLPFIERDARKRLSPLLRERMLQLAPQNAGVREIEKFIINFIRTYAN